MVGLLWRRQFSEVIEGFFLAKSLVDTFFSIKLEEWPLVLA